MKDRQANMEWNVDPSSNWMSGSGALNDTTDAFEDNLTLSCAARNIQGPVMLPYSTTFVDTVRAFQAILLFLVCFVSTVLNILVIVLVAKFKKLQTLSFGIALHIVVLNLIWTIILSFGLVNSVANRWIFGKHMCAILGAVFYTIAQQRISTMFVFVIDRFLVVFFPFGYPKYQKKTVVVLIVISWLLALMIVTSSSILDCYAFIPDTWLCLLNGACNKICFIAVSILLITTTAPMTVIPIFLYALLFIKARKAKKAMAKTSVSTEQLHDWKATITFFLMFLTVFVLILPNLVVSLILRLMYTEEDIMPIGLYVLSIIVTRFLTLPVVTDAIVILKNDDVRKVLARLKRSFVRKSCKKTDNANGVQ